MTTITFDTLELVDKLKNAGIPQEQAEAVEGEKKCLVKLITKYCLKLLL